MRVRYLVLAVLGLIILQTPSVHAAVITIRTGQVGGVPGSCPGLDDSFHYYAPQTQCAAPLQSTAFQSTDFDMACSGPPAPIATAYSGAWTPNLTCDLDARWISSSTFSCYGTSVSALYCADFNVDPSCTLADSIRVCWVVDDALGDPSGNGPNPGGVYINGVSLGSAFSGGNYSQETTAVAYNVSLLPGLNRLEVYQRDLGCAVAGVMLNCTLYTNCGTVPTEKRSWGSLKAIYR